MRNHIGLLLGAAVSAGCARPPRVETSIAEEAVAYDAQGELMNGYLAYDSSTGAKRPGILVVPEWWGVNDYPRMRARMLAELGYTALVVDMYGGGRAVTTPDEAGRLSTELREDPAKASVRFAAALAFLRAQPTVDPDRIAAIGYCFGGGVVLTMARQGAELRGVVSFHGTLSPVEPAQPGAIRGEVLVLTGGADPFVPPEQVAAFEQEMAAAGASFRVISYPGALHAFTNPAATETGAALGLPIAYDEAADRESWSEMKTFLSRVLAP
ncbi:MAG: dienelactone hydrolase family protein [Deltaproteobacteria bacterium]|nr:dienelactone hydrolase family protein [Deltaproteobacteria bacterium]